MPNQRYSDGTLRQVVRLHDLFVEGALPGPEKHEVHPCLPVGSRDNYLYFTLPCCLNFQRRSPALWRSALDSFKDSETNYLYFPEQVIERAPARIQHDLVKHKLALQTNKHAAIWIRICQTLATHYTSDPRKVLEEAGFDVKQIIQTLQRDKKHLFPYLSGMKLSNYWLFILANFTDASLRNIEEISIIPDTHVIKSTVRLGLAEPGVTPTIVESLWREIVKEARLSPIEMHSALWRWSRNGFAPTLD